MISPSLPLKEACAATVIAPRTCRRHREDGSKSWHTCPTCRGPVVPLEIGTTAAGQQKGSHSEAHRHGTGSTAQAEVDSGMETDSLSQHQARLQAAYEKSCVYHSTNSVVCSPGYLLYQPIQRSVAESSSIELKKEQQSSEQAQAQAQ